MEFVFKAKIIPNLLKNDVIVEDTFEVLFQVQMIWHKLFWKARGRLEMPMKKTKGFICFEMPKRKLEVFLFLFFLVFK
jgi:hypothetical protein